MPLFQVLQQLPPEQRDDEFYARFEVVGTVRAESGAEAIELAKKWPLFRSAQRLARFPAVQEVT